MCRHELEVLGRFPLLLLLLDLLLDDLPLPSLLLQLPVVLLFRLLELLLIALLRRLLRGLRHRSERDSRWATASTTTQDGGYLSSGQFRAKISTGGGCDG